MSVTVPGAVLAVGTPGTNITEMCKLLTFLLEVVSIETYVETSSEHLPRLFQVRKVQGFGHQKS